MGRMASVIADRWLMVLGCLLLVAGSALIYVQVLAKPVFESTATVTYAAPSQTNPTVGALPSTGITRENIATLVTMAARNGVIDQAAAKAGVEPRKLVRSVAVRQSGDASAIEFVARADDAEQAASLANAYAGAFVADRTTAVEQAIKPQVASRQRDLAELQRLRLTADDPRTVTLNNLRSEIAGMQSDLVEWSGALQPSQAQAPEEPVWPRTTLTMFAAVLIGLALGVAAALLTARVDTRVLGDSSREMPAAVVARVPLSRSAPDDAPLGPDRAEPLVGDAFAALGSRVVLDRSGEGAHVVLVTSARSGEGKSTVAANLASALAQGGRRVVLVDADMRKPSQDRVFPALQGRPGLSQVLTGATSVEHALTLVAPNLAAIASGPRQANASTLLASVTFRSLIDRLTNICELVVIDAPPVLAVQDALAMAPSAHQALLCVRVGRSDSDEIAASHEGIGVAAPKIAQGIVLLGTTRPTGYGYDGDDMWPSGGSGAGPGAPPITVTTNGISALPAPSGASEQGPGVSGAGVVG